MSKQLNLSVSDADFFQPADIPESFKKAVGVVQVAMGKLGLLHRRCYNIALANAYEGLGKGQLKFRMPVSLVVDWAQYDSHNYQALYDVFEELRITQVRPITFDTTESKKGRARRKIGSEGLIAGFSLIEGGIIEYSFTEEMAKILYEPDQYIWMSLTVQNRFSSKYELNLFENIIRYQRVGTTGFKAVEDWKKLLGATEETYTQFKRFNDLVLKPAVKGVNEKSGVLVALEFKREKRKISEIKFSVTENPQLGLLDYQEHNKIRKSDLYQQLLAYEISDAVAIYWIESKGERYVHEALDYTEAKKPEKNFAGYLADAVRKGYGQKTDAQRENEAQVAKEAVEHQKKREERRDVFARAIEYKFIEKQHQAKISAFTDDLIVRLEQEPDQDQLLTALAAELQATPSKAADLVKRGWASKLARADIRRFACDKYREKPKSIEQFFLEAGANYKSLMVAAEDIERSFLREKLTQACERLSSQSKPDFKVLAQDFT